jgi:hypothetical protein
MNTIQSFKYQIFHQVSLGTVIIRFLFPLNMLHAKTYASTLTYWFENNMGINEDVKLSVLSLFQYVM